MKYIISLVIASAVVVCTLMFGKMTRFIEPVTQDGVKIDSLTLQKDALEEFEPLPRRLIDAREHRDLIALGEKLYFEKRLSVNDTISCNSCHKIDRFGVDNEATSPGHDGTRGGRNSPSSFNAALHISQFWDGRAKDLAEQAIGPILNPIEHGIASEEDALLKINTKEYRRMFTKAFSGNEEAFTYKNIGVAIGAFEKTLITPSRFDGFLRGNVNALSRSEKLGLKKFMEVGCTTCHNGVGIGGGMYQKLGLVNEYPTSDLGRFEVTKNEDDKGTFKVPSLRNIEKTHPYFHDGSVTTLSEAVDKMAWHQLGERLSESDNKLIRAFLGSLTGTRTRQF